MNINILALKKSVANILIDVYAVTGGVQLFGTDRHIEMAGAF